MTKRRVCFVGTGSIAHTHAEALRSRPDAELAAIVEKNTELAQQFAAKWGAKTVYADIDAALASGTVDCAHILVPPALHRAVAEPFLAKAIPVLVEKPLATSAADCAALNALAAKNNTLVAVNQNYIYNPAFLRLRHMVEQRKLGRLLAVQALYSMPLRQLAARQFTHWMFQEPLNIILEQGVHPLSQIAALIGPIESITGSAAAPITIGADGQFYPEFSVTYRAQKVVAQLHFGVGRSFPTQQITAICDDGIIVADTLNARLTVAGRTRWIDPVDTLVSGCRTGAALAAESVRGALDYGLALLRLRPRSDPFFLSMKGSIDAFHDALAAGGRCFHDGGFGQAIVEACEETARTVYKPAPASPQQATVAAPAPVTGISDVVLLGGTGFIGVPTLKRLLAQGKTVTVGARGVANLPAVFQQRGVRLIQANVTRATDLEKAIGQSPVVVNLAHGGGGDTWQQIEERMAGSARMVAELCLGRPGTRLIHVSSIAALYLGDAGETISNATTPDRQPEQRAFYARAKVVAELALLEMHRTKGLPVCILRPGVVVGDGTSPFHSGVGSYNNDQHCLGWNAGDNPLPFVLVDDVAFAVERALEPGTPAGSCFNLVGDVRLTARDYTREVATALQRPLKFHPQAVQKLYAIEIAKWLIKKAGGRSALFPSLRDLKSRGLVAKFDCATSHSELGWRCIADRAQFIEQAIAVHARGL